MNLRVCASVAQLAAKFEAEVVVYRDWERADGKSILELASLAAEQGTELSLEVSGQDAEPLLDALVKLFAGDFGPGRST
jgi:phosphocarrier protein